MMLARETKGETSMRKSASIVTFLFVSTAFMPVYAAETGGAPDFQSNGIAWIAMNQDLVPVPGEQPPTNGDKAHPYVPNGRGAQPTFRIADLTNPNLKPWAKDVMKKDNDEVLKGKIAFTARSSCMPAGVPGFSSFIVEPVYFIQSPKELLMVYAGNQELRHVYMDAQHSRNPKPSWYGESVGHYEGDTLVVDTTGLNNKTFVDNYRTPHTEKLHVVERYRLVNNGNNLEVSITADDADTFNQPWSAMQRYRRVQQGPLDEQVCAENNLQLFDYGVPHANKPDF
jgi:hypothetical protein